MPKKILHIVGSLEKGGIQSTIMNYYKNINKEKYQFDIIVHGHADGYEEEFKSLGGKVIEIPKFREIGIIKYIKRIINEIQKNGPYDVVHSHLMQQTGFVLIAAKYAGVKVRISHSHSTRVTGFLSKPLLPLWKSLIKRNATELIACGEKAGEFLYGKSKFKVIPNAIEYERFGVAKREEINQIKKSFYISKDTLILGHVGRFVSVKNHMFMIELLKGCIDKGLDVKLILIGDGPLKNDVSEKAKKLGVSDSVLFLGLRNDIPKLLNMFDIFLLPSFNEGVPVVLVESQAVGLRAIVSDSVSDEIDLGINLIDFIPLSDSAKWIEKITQFERRNINRFTVDSVFNHSTYNIKNAIKELNVIYDK